jgi:uncharacterized protein (DUF58 family)
VTELPFYTRVFAIWVAVAAVVGVVGWLKSINLFSVLSYLMLAVGGVNLFLAWRMVRKVTAVRHPPPSLFAGETATIVGTVTNHSSYRAVVTLHQIDTSPRSWFFPALPGRETLAFTGTVGYANRGRHPLPKLEITSGYPFGLGHFTRPVPNPGEVIVLPALGHVDLVAFRRWLVRAACLGDSSRRVLRRAAPADGDVRGVRPYRMGDSPRDVHWKSSARRDQLLVREYDRTPPMDLTIVIDPWVPSVPTDRHSAAKLEWALSLAVSVAWAWVHAELPGDLTLLVGGERWTTVSGHGTPAFVRTGFECLADVRGCPNLGPVPADLYRASARASRLLVSTRPAGPVAGELRATGLGVAVVEPSVRPTWFVPKAVT